MFDYKILCIFNINFFKFSVFVFCLFVWLDLLTVDIWQIYSKENVYIIVFVLSLFLSIFLTGLSSIAASYLNPVKSFVPQMPKLLKSLFPVRDEKRGKQSSPFAHQVKASESNSEHFLIDYRKMVLFVALKTGSGDWQQWGWGGIRNGAFRPGKSL